MIELKSHSFALFSVVALDVLVNSAGILISGPTETLSWDGYDTIMNINTKAAFVLTQVAIPYLRKTKGNIVHVSSVTGKRIRLLNWG